MRATLLKSVRAILIAFISSASVQAVTIDMVTVGNPGNAPDTRYNAISVGAVDYVYEIGKYEVTAGQYTEFLNAVAKDDPDELWNNGMNLNPAAAGAGIVRTGLTANFSYSVAPDYANRPVNCVTFWNAARFANWLQNGQPKGPEGPGTTEDGAYHNVGNPDLFGRNPGARFFIPTEDEWYKAAYHNSSSGLAANYFDYPTGSNLPPANTLPDTSNHANFNDNGQTIGTPYYRTNVGEFANSPSPYGTFDQGGNIAEWNETEIGFWRGLRGGSFISGLDTLDASTRGGSAPGGAGYDAGFRIAGIAIPEPTTLTLAIAVIAKLLTVRRRPTSHNRV